MARKPRIEYPGAFYHVMCRGNNGEYVFTEEEKPEYVKLIEKYKKRYSFSIYAYCLMDNHAHLLIETGEIPLSKIMQGIQQSFTQYYNKKYGRTGHVFQQRYKAQLCDKKRFLWQLIKYIHYNPVEAGFNQGLDYKWSSHKSYITGRNDPLVEVSFILSILSENPATAQKQYRQFMNIEPDTTTIEQYQAVLGPEEELKNPMIRNRKIKLEVIVDEVCKEAGVVLEEIIRRTKIQKFSDVRKAIVRLSEKYSEITNIELARRLNIPPSMISKIKSGECRGTHLVDEIMSKIEEKGIFQA
ncbi:MAG: transposase [Bacillota bacterium]